MYPNFIYFIFFFWNNKKKYSNNGDAIMLLTTFRPSRFSVFDPQLHASLASLFQS